MTVRLAPSARQQFLDTAGNPYVGAKLFTYLAGTSTKQATYTTSAGDVANSNPIILDAAGRTPSGLWLTEGADYKFVLAPAFDTDPPTSAIYTEDNINGVNDGSDLSASLSADAGSSLIGHQPTSGAATTVQLELRSHEAELAAIDVSKGNSVSVFDFMTTAQIADVKDGTALLDVTAAIQAAIDEVYTAGGGEVFVPEGTYKISATASTESWETYAAGGIVTAIPAGACCLIMRNRVYLRGAGMNNSVFLMPANTGLKGIFVTSSPNGYGMADFTLDGNWDSSAEVNSHGIFWVTSTTADEANTLFSDGEIRNVRVRRVGSYGFGLQHGVFRGNLFDNIRTERTGADGLDAKNRHANKGNRITNATIAAFGLRTSLVAQAGIDLRGEGWAVIAPRVYAFGRADTNHTGIRFTPGAGTNGTTAEKSFVSDFIIEATNTNSYGVESYAAGCTIGPGSITGCAIGVWNKSHEGGTAVDNIVTGVAVDGLGVAGNAFASEDATVLRTRWIGCTAKNISQGWRPAGTDEQIIGCAVDGSVTTPLSEVGAPVNLVITSSPSLQEEQRAPSFLSAGPLTVANDTAILLSTGSGGYQNTALIGTNSAGSGFSNGLFLFRSNASPQCSALAMQTTTNVIFSTGVKTGTTGAVGDFTISAVDGGLYFENRTGTTKEIVLTMFGDR